MNNITFQYIFFAILACINAAITNYKNVPANEEIDFVPIVKSVAERKEDGSFLFAYEGGDGSFRKEVGVIQNPGTDDEALEVSGSYRYIDADGQEVEVHYTAGKGGFVPEGTNIPKEITQAAQAAAEFARSIKVNDN